MAKTERTPAQLAADKARSEAAKKANAEKAAAAQAEAQNATTPTDEATTPTVETASTPSFGEADASTPDIGGVAEEESESKKPIFVKGDEDAEEQDSAPDAPKATAQVLPQETVTTPKPAPAKAMRGTVMPELVLRYNVLATSQVVYKAGTVVTPDLPDYAELLPHC